MFPTLEVIYSRVYIIYNALHSVIVVYIVHSLSARDERITLDYVTPTVARVNTHTHANRLLW